MPRRITIAGSGPAGLSVAINLAKAGFDVHVYERNVEVGQRFHGDLQGLENWSRKVDVLEDLARMNIDVNFECDPFRTLTITNGDLTHDIKGQRPHCYLVKRGAMSGSLDQGLKQQALAAGVQLHLHQALPIEQTDIVATGPRLGEVFAVDAGIVFKTSLPDMAVGVLHDPGAWKGYGYLLVTKGYGCLCVMLFEQFPEAHHCLQETRRLLEQKYRLNIRDPHDVGGIGSWRNRPQWEDRGRQLVGEASGLQDFLWGFGIRNAITSGWLAAQSIITGQSYARLADAHFSRRLKAGLVNRWLWHLASRRNYRSVIQILRLIPNPPGLLRSFYNFNPFQRLCWPLAERRIRRQYPQLAW
ncbi:MAG: NAD(P)/FAD-dependent oxidoreductase [Patescibacteria group bacterium]